MFSTFFYIKINMNIYFDILKEKLTMSLFSKILIVFLKIKNILFKNTYILYLTSFFEDF